MCNLFSTSKHTLAPILCSEYAQTHAHTVLHVNVQRLACTAVCVACDRTGSGLRRRPDERQRHDSSGRHRRRRPVRARPGLLVANHGAAASGGATHRRRCIRRRALTDVHRVRLPAGTTGCWCDRVPIRLGARATGCINDWTPVRFGAGTTEVMYDSV